MWHLIKADVLITRTSTGNFIWLGWEVTRPTVSHKTFDCSALLTLVDTTRNDDSQHEHRNQKLDYVAVHFFIKIAQY